MSGTSRATLAWILDHIRDHMSTNGCDDMDCPTCAHVWPAEQRGALLRRLSDLEPFVHAYDEASTKRDEAAEIESERGTEIPPGLYHARDDAAVEVAERMGELWPMLVAAFRLDA